MTESDFSQGELLRKHYRLGHISFRKLRALAILKIIPRKLANIIPLKCVTCIYGGMIRTPWRPKGGKSKSNVKECTSPGQCVSMDQLESSTPGFIAQLKRRLTKDWYNCARI